MPALTACMHAHTRGRAWCRAGGYGHDWGIKYDADGQLVAAPQDRGPLFNGQEGQEQLRAAVMEYAPLWQVEAAGWW